MIRRARRNTVVTVLTMLASTFLAACRVPPPPVDPDAEVPFYPPANRPDVRGTKGAVSSDHPLAAQAGLRVLQEGGNAVDAALAMAAVLAVVRPHMNGVGGDAFVLVYEAATGEVHALNGSGRSGALATPAFFRDQGLDEVPSTGPLSVSAPGAVAAWVDVHERFGSRPFAGLLAPAIGYARDGFPVSTRLASDFGSQSRALNEPGKALYLPRNGEAPEVGSLLKNPALAATLERIASQGKAGFYQGPVAETLAAFLEAQGSHLRASDFAAHASTWVEPLRGSYLEHDILVFPPNTQGTTQLQLFEMAKSFPLKEMGHNTSPYLHTLVEISKLAFADRDRWMADPEQAEIPLDQLLDPAYLAERAKLVDPARAAQDVGPGIGGEAGAPGDRDDSGDTVYLTAVDQWGNAVSWIQSLFAGFGSGLLEPETGVLLHNRGSLYTLEDGHPNQVAPGKRPFHTLTPMMALQGGELAFTLGTPGGDSQPQSLLQIVNNLLLFGMTPQQAIEAPRFRAEGGVALEHRVRASVRAKLAAMGHDLRVVEGWTATFGGAQMIRREPGFGTLTVASDPRREAYGLAW
ncbi:MAG: gamma-glutamyltransferase [Longimicrobiales bacterium]|nr:gamma-glutamyltransferase [Longimicrobiales bacterium]